MYKILKYLGFAVLLALFFASSFGVAFLAQFSTSILDIKTNFINLIPVEIWIIINTFIFGLIIILIRNF